MRYTEGMKILVVDDEQPIRQVCERALRRDGNEVLSCASAKEASERLGEGWDLVLSDVTMPGGMDGHELLRRARQESGADVILMTGYPGLDSAIAALKGGGYDYLIKPFGIDALLGAVRRCQEKRELSRELAREKKLREELERTRRAQQAFGQFATPEVARFVLERPEDFLKRGERRTVTTLFVDVRGFTSFAERVQPEEAVLSLNEVMELVIAAVHAEGGIVNKFLGDGLMAVFGAPLPHADHAGAAARAALKARAAVENLARERRGLCLEFLRFGFGINTGEAVAGCFGTMERAEYTVIGHAVNVAARLEGSAKAGQILIGPATAELLGERFLVGRGVALDLAGLSESLRAAELLGRAEELLPS